GQLSSPATSCVQEGKKGMHKSIRSSRRLTAIHLLGLSCAAVLSLTAGPAWAAGFKADLESHSFGSTNWSTANPTGYKELDYIPIRVVLTGGPATAKP